MEWPSWILRVMVFIYSFLASKGKEEGRAEEGRAWSHFQLMFFGICGLWHGEFFFDG